ncbi:MAG: type I restriction endonuclease subunit R, partial [Selenomonadaceae bacterium]|nr:type I restriction endonuclease subunit R [Selenomonadaceae bacterium]
MHRAIVRHFKRYYMFGFTGTPIFALNAEVGTQQSNGFTTEQTFGDQLHTYTIVNAINDKNVLPFRVDYFKTMSYDDDIDDEKVRDIDRKKALEAPARISLVAEYILEHFNQKTYRRQFNSIFAVGSISMARKYYAEFQRLIKNDPAKHLKIAVIYSYAPNEDDATGILGEENPEDTGELDQTARDFLDSAIADYNEMFHTSFDTSGDKFQNYYKDVSQRMKNRELDLLIVVNMFLTGFDATKLNTLWVDKNLKLHGLIQAFSRTNRILNSVKTFGNIVCFRNLQRQVDIAISLFGDDNAGGIILIPSFQECRHDYKNLIEELTAKFPVSEPRLESEERQRAFIVLFGEVLKKRNTLLAFDEFNGNDLLSERDLQDYLGKYQDLRDDWIRRKAIDESTDVTDDIIFEIELIRQIEINIDYILMLVKRYHDGNREDKELLITIKKAINAAPELRSKKKLIEAFIADVSVIEDVIIEWNKYVAEQREIELTRLIQEERLKPKETRQFMDSAFHYGELKTFGTDINKVMPPMSRFGGGNRTAKKIAVTEKLLAFFEKYFGIGEAPKFTASLSR